MESLSTIRPHDMRRYKRKPYARTINYSVSVLEAKDRKLLNLTGKSIDISEAGICIQTDHPLSPGHILWFNGSIEDKAGFVRWCSQLDNEYRVGIELDGTHIKNLEEATETFNRRLEEIERKCLNPQKDTDELLNEITKAIFDIRHTYEEFEQEVKDKDVIHDAQIRFREKTNSVLSKSYFLNRARTWPQGYQGDYKMLEGIYRNTPLSEGLGYLLDLYFLNMPINESARQRITKLEEILQKELQNRHQPSLLNIACGSCREVFELAKDIEKSDAKFTCIDLDNDALAFAANRLSYTNISPLSSDQVKFRKYNALRMFDHELNMNEFGKQDIIYSVGFFDYLPSDFLVNMLKALYDLLNPGGLLIAAFKDARRYISSDCHWIADWDGFLQRNEEDFRNILFEVQVPDSAIMETRIDSGIIIFYLMTK